MKEFATHDIVLAATLSCANYTLNRIDVSGFRGTFVFENVEDAVITKFDLRGSLVEPQAFNAAIRSLTTAVRRLTNQY